MPRWTPTAEWIDADVFIIGGGPSLQRFQWERLRGHKTIGCNSAFLLGAGVCSLCFFSDETWFNKFEASLAHFDGRVVTHSVDMEGREHPWVFQVPRLEKDELAASGGLMFGGNSGVGAVNLALQMGAKRVFLLGFDCKAHGATTHWHDRALEVQTDEHYAKFIEGWGHVASSLSRVFPGTQVLNATPGSALPFFPLVNIDDYLE